MCTNNEIQKSFLIKPSLPSGQVVHHPNLEIGIRKKPHRAPLGQLEAVWGQSGCSAEWELWWEAWNGKREKDTQKETTNPRGWKPRAYFESWTVLGSVGQTVSIMIPRNQQSGEGTFEGEEPKGHTGEWGVYVITRAPRRKTAGPLGFSEKAHWRRWSCC